MKVRVRYFTTLRELAGIEEEDIEIRVEGTLFDLIKKIVLKHGEKAFNYLYVEKTCKIDPSIKFLINGVNANLKTEMNNGDIVAIIPPIGGG